MDDLIGRLVANSGVDWTAAEEAVGIVAQFLLQEEPCATDRALIQYMPGQDAAMSASPPRSRSPGMLDARLFDARTLDASIGVSVPVTSAGPGFGERRGAAREPMSFARDNAGEDAVGLVVGAIPGLGQFV